MRIPIPGLMRLLACLLLCSPLPSPAAGTPTHLEVSYNILKDGFTAATITETYTRHQDEYRVESVSKAVGILALIKPETIRVVSAGRITAKGLHPLTFTNQRTLDSDRNASADFDWANNQITLNDRSGTRTLPLPAGTQDRLSAMYQFLFLSLKNITRLDFYMTNGSKVDIYNYLISPEQKVTVPLGTFNALYIASPPKAGESRTEIWLAAEHADFPCKMVITDPDGGKLTQVLTRFEATP